MITSNIGHFQVMESFEIIGAGMTAQRWFVRSQGDVCRTVLYLFNDEWVVAFQDCINGENCPLYMDEAFMDLHRDEPEFEAILLHSGVLSINKIQTYNTGR